MQRAGQGERTAYALAGGRVTGRADAAARVGDEDVTKDRRRTGPVFNSGCRGSRSECTVRLGAVCAEDQGEGKGTYLRDAHVAVSLGSV